METTIPTYSEATVNFLSRLRHPANRIARILLNPVKDNAISISMNELVDAEIRVYDYEDGVAIYEAIGWVDNVNGDEQVVVICVTTDWKEARTKIVEFYHQFI